jgi:hypothetical protein
MAEEATTTALERITVQGRAVSPELRKFILEDAKAEILAGKTLLQIAQKHGIAKRTLEYWLANLGDEYVELRRLWVDNLLAEAGEMLENDDESGNAGLRLARARELWKRATWYAERRDRARYGEEKAQINVSGDGIKIELVSFGQHADTKPLDVVGEADVSLCNVGKLK